MDVPQRYWPQERSKPTPPSSAETFLFKEIEGSARLAEQHPAVWSATVARHHAIFQTAIESHRGYFFQVIGDAFYTAHHTVPDALAAAFDAQRTLHT